MKLIFSMRVHMPKMLRQRPDKFFIQKMVTFSNPAEVFTGELIVVEVSNVNAKSNFLFWSSVPLRSLSSRRFNMSPLG